MTLTAEQCLARVEAIAVASTIAGLDELRQDAHREFGLDVRGSFVELLIDLRQERLEQQRRHASRIA
jgi:hypothetical protein